MCVGSGYSLQQVAIVYYCIALPAPRVVSNCSATNAVHCSQDNADPCVATAKLDMFTDQSCIPTNVHVQTKELIHHGR